MVKGLQKTKLAIQALNERVRAEQQRTESYKKRGIEKAEEAEWLRRRGLKQRVKAIRDHSNRIRDIKLYLKHKGVDRYTRTYWENQLPKKSKSFFKI